MSTKLVVECDYDEGCVEEFDAFNPEIPTCKMDEILRERGWSIVEDEVFAVHHFCPQHTLKTEPEDKEQAE